MFTDYVENGVGSFDLVDESMRTHFDPGLQRPMCANNGRTYFVVNTGQVKEDGTPIKKNVWKEDLQKQGVLVSNATSLRKDEWILLDSKVLQVFRTRLRAYDDLRAANTMGGFDGMATPILQWETESDPGTAIVDMDGITTGNNDSPKFQLQSMPLPITRSDYHYSARQLAASRRIGMGLDVSSAESSARRVAEAIERTTIGTQVGMTFGATPAGGNASTVFGYTNHPDRLVNTSLTVPDGTNGTTTVSEILGLLDDLNAANVFGPFVIYHSTDWTQFLGDDYKADSDLTLQERIMAIEGVSDVRRLDELTTTFTLLIVELNSEGRTARAINGMDITTVRWQDLGGRVENFSVMAIQVPNLRSDFNGNMGLMQATTA